VGGELEEFRAKFRVAELLVHENEHWCWSVRPVQCTLGAGVLSARQGASRLSELPVEAGAHFLGMAQVIERVLGQMFEYDRINYLMLMMVDPHVHFHVVPRYSRPVRYAGQMWSDAGWPGPPLLDGPAPDRGILEDIRAALQRGV
jgi:diadenosine tetraphosphate (Ap4A) HIT family hydrolase